MPQAEMYDAELVDLLAALAKHHLAKTFPILSVQVGSSRTSWLYNLAMAAVGGLFCDLPGRVRVVNAMYNDTRRMFLQRAERGGFHSLANKLNAIKTFMLLETYGLCSGDKRSFEFVEVFHSRMLFLVGDFKKALFEQAISSPQPVEQASRALSLSLYVLECYRVVLLLRPPDSFFRSLFRFGWGDGNTASEYNAADRLVDALFTPDAPVSANYSYHDSASALLTIAILASPRLAGSDSSSIVRTLWRSEYFELALSKWARVQSPDSADWSLLTLYHLICINLHTNIGLIQRLVHVSSGLRGDVRASKTWSSLDIWRKSRHYPAARWHAQTILSRVNEVLASGNASQQSNEDDILKDSNSKTLQQAVVPESPHLPYAVYSATLVLWCGDYLSAGSTSPAGMAYINTSILLLASMRVRIAALFQRTLRRLRNRPLV